MCCMAWPSQVQPASTRSTNQWAHSSCLVGEQVPQMAAGPVLISVFPSVVEMHTKGWGRRRGEFRKEDLRRGGSEGRVRARRGSGKGVAVGGHTTGQRRRPHRHESVCFVPLGLWIRIANLRSQVFGSQQELVVEVEILVKKNFWKERF